MNVCTILKKEDFIAARWFHIKKKGRDGGDVDPNVPRESMRALLTVSAALRGSELGSLGGKLGWGLINFKSMVYAAVCHC
jgi:hypothetical protein